MNQIIPKPKSRAEGARIILVLSSVVIVVAGLKLAADFIVPILMAFFIATISFPIMNWLREHRVPRFFAVMITVLVDFAFIAGVVLLGVVLVSELQAKWETKYYKLTTQRVEQFTKFTTDFYEKWGLKGKAEEENVEPASSASLAPNKSENPTENPSSTSTDGQGDSALGDITQAQTKSTDTSKDTSAAKLTKTKKVAHDENSLTGIEELKNQLLAWLSAENVLQWAQSLFKQLTSFLSVAFIVMLLTIFMLSEARVFGRRFSAICDAKGPNLQRMRSATKDIQRYLGIKTLISMATGLLAGLLCWQMGLEFPLLWGILAFALNFIPAVGSVIAGIPPILLSLLNNGDISDAMLIALGYLIINGFLGNFLEPTLLGRRFGISTVVVILSVIFWGWLWGPVGMLMAVPLTMLLKVGLDNSSDFRWIGVAISKESKLHSEEDQIMIKEAIEAKTKEMFGEEA